MGIFESIGLVFVIFTSSLGAYVFIRFAMIGVHTALRQKDRGELEEEDAMRRDVMLKAIERSAG